MTLVTNTLLSVGQSTVSRLTTSPFFNRKETTKRLTQIFVRLIDQPNIKLQLSFYC